MVRSNKDVFPEPGELTKLMAKIFLASKYPLFRSANKSFLCKISLSKSISLIWCVTDDRDGDGHDRGHDRDYDYAHDAPFP